MPQEPPAGIVIDMTPDKALAALDGLLRDREAGEAAVKATPGAIVDALKAGVTAAEIARRLKMSEGYVRKFRREAGLQDQRYAHLKPPAPEEPAPESASGRRDVRSLNAQTIRRLAALAEESAPDGWAHRVAAGIPAEERPYTLVIAALDEEYLTASQIPR